MLHEPAEQQGPDHAAAYKMRLGAVMFLVYAAFYAGFVAINVMWPALMELPVLLGMNLAVVYGFALIVVALLLALAYNHWCAARENALTAESGKVAVSPSVEEGR